jgi:hypothetical protein
MNKKLKIRILKLLKNEELLKFENLEKRAALVETVQAYSERVSIEFINFALTPALLSRTPDFYKVAIKLWFRGMLGEYRYDYEQVLTDETLLTLGSIEQLRLATDAILQSNIRNLSSTSDVILNFDLIRQPTKYEAAIDSITKASRLFENRYIARLLCCPVFTSMPDDVYIGMVQLTKRTEFSSVHTSKLNNRYSMSQYITFVIEPGIPIFDRRIESYYLSVTSQNPTDNSIIKGNDSGDDAVPVTKKQLEGLKKLYAIFNSKDEIRRELKGPIYDDVYRLDFLK